MSGATFDGLALVKAIQEGRPGMEAPGWVRHLKVDDENVIDSVEAGRMVSTWTPGAHLTVSDGYVLGGLIAAMADGFQSLTLMTTQTKFEIWVTLDLHTRFLRPIKAGTPVRIENVVLNKSQTSAMLETTFTSAADGKLAAKATGGWRKAEIGPRAELKPPVQS